MTMKELAKEYRRSAALVKARMQKRKAENTLLPEDLRIMRQMISDCRQAARTCSHYYDLPRPGEIDALIYYGGGHREDDN